MLTRLAAPVDPATEEPKVPEVAAPEAAAAGKVTQPSLEQQLTCTAPTGEKKDATPAAPAVTA